jgi:hypothetical protein
MTSEKTEYEKGFEAGIVAGVEVERQHVLDRWPSIEVFSAWYAKDYPYTPNARSIYEWLKSFVEKGTK